MPIPTRLGMPGPRVPASCSASDSYTDPQGGWTSMSPVNAVPVEVMVGMSWQTIEPLTCQASDINVCPYIYLSVYHLYIHMYNVYTYKYFHLFSIYAIIPGAWPS
jgi:hypothetical protein